MARTRILLFLLSLILVPLFSYLVILFARGYRLQPTNPQIVTPTGLLAVSSNPDGAQIFISGLLKSATNTTISLPPGPYTVEIKKDGFAPWKKLLRLDPEIVTRAYATLFPSVPSLKAITFSTATNPLLSPDGGKVAYVLVDKTMSKVFTIDLSESPLGAINRDSRLVATLNNVDLSQANLDWSPDSKQILATSTPSAYLLDTSNTQSISFVANPQTIKKTWSDLKVLREAQKFSSLPSRLQEILTTSSSDLVWSPKENKLMYTATASAVLAENLSKQLPGSSTQTQARTLESGKVYVYDLEEDRNFLIGEIPPKAPSPIPAKGKKPIIAPTPQPPILSWFPTSSHLLKVEPNKITIFEYDSQNPVVVYAGPMANSFAVSYPSGKYLLLLTNLNPASSVLPNLYALSLK